MSADGAVAPAAETGAGRAMGLVAGDHRAAAMGAQTDPGAVCGIETTAMEEGNRDHVGEVGEAAAGAQTTGQGPEAHEAAGQITIAAAGMTTTQALAPTTTPPVHEIPGGTRGAGAGAIEATTPPTRPDGGLRIV